MERKSLMKVLFAFKKTPKKIMSWEKTQPILRPKGKENDFIITFIFFERSMKLFAKAKKKLVASSS